MFGRLVQKELLSQLLDLRFVVVCALCALLSALSVYVGIQNHVRRSDEYNTVTRASQRAFQEASIDKGNLSDLIRYGYRWNRRPEVLSSVVYGLSGTTGKEAHIRYRKPPLFENSHFATDPIHGLFEVLDLAFIVKVVLSLAVLLFTHDAVCGEKEGGTLRLYASFSVVSFEGGPGQAPRLDGGRPGAVSIRLSIGLLGAGPFSGHRAPGRGLDANRFLNGCVYPLSNRVCGVRAMGIRVDPSTVSRFSWTPCTLDGLDLRGSEPGRRGRQANDSGTDIDRAAKKKNGPASIAKQGIGCRNSRLLPSFPC